VTVAYATAPGSAAPGEDYVTNSGVITFAPGVISQTIPITILEDDEVEGGQNFTVNLSAPDGGVLGSPATATVTINDNDVIVPVAAFASGSVTVEEEVGVVYLTVNIAPATTVTVTVGYATSAGTAAPGDDYSAASGTLTFAPGVTSRTIPITIVDDDEVEGDQSFSVILSNPNGLTLGNPAAVTITISAHEEGYDVFLPVMIK
jgi:hypothetical protein